MCPVIPRRIKYESTFKFSSYFRHFRIILPFVIASILLALIYAGRIVFEKTKEKFKKSKNQVRDINYGIGPSKVMQQPVHQNGFNNLSHNPKIMSTLALTFTLIICWVYAAVLYSNIYLQNFAITRALKLGLHRTLISFAIPLFFYCKNSSLRRFVYEMYFSHLDLWMSLK